MDMDILWQALEMKDEAENKKVTSLKLLFKCYCFPKDHVHCF